MLLFDLSHTSHTHARTGIQRVCRSLFAEAQAAAQAAVVTYDPYRRAWRTLDRFENETLTALRTAKKRGARWSWQTRLRGRLAHRLRRPLPTLPKANGLVVPELFSAEVAAALPSLFTHVNGPRVAIFHDAIALKFPELSPPKTVSRFPAYLTELLAFDGIAAVSEDSRQTLLDYWKWIGAASHPPVQTFTLGLTPPPVLPTTINPSTRPIVLCVGSIEGRKNHVALLDACESLWSSGVDFTLRLVGLAHPQTGKTALEKIAALQTAGRPLLYDGPIDDAGLETAYAQCTFTVYPSLIEGFGLPVFESLARGRPCLCSSRGALGEAASSGGCLALPSVGATELADGLARLLQQDDLREKLIGQARARRFKTWRDYTRELISWMSELPQRPLR